MTAGLYLHVPFCKSRCSYCDFATDVYRSNDAVGRYVDALVTEVSGFDNGNSLIVSGKSIIENREDGAEAPDDRKYSIYHWEGCEDSPFAHWENREDFRSGNRKSKIKNRKSIIDQREDLAKAPDNRKLQIANRKSPIDSIYFGGGTPSLLTASQLEKIIGSVHTVFDASDDAEITLEMNPATVTPEKLRDFRSLGVNRASFGVQTFDDRALKLLARGHDANDARETFKMLRAAGFDNVSFDLIGGLPGQTIADWEKNLDEAIAMNPEHLSLYLLEIHSGTPLAEQVRSKRQPAPDEDLSGEMYEMMLDKTAASGLLQYEISNFARPGRESWHNTKYWLCEPVYAFGVSAHSFDGKVRRANERDTNRYVQLIESGESAVVEEIPVDAKQLASEFAFLKLRLNAGLNLSDYKARFGIDLATKYSDEMVRLRELELIEVTEDVLRLTRRGMVYSNEVFSVFV